ncbi:MAG TPA: hypothetical protein VK195_03530 [Burkholderiaceae bacterium]|nr:hypothetical protein [Burkholderiaceae bacterium]
MHPNVASAQQAEWLRREGCDWAQGWHYGRPMPAEAFELSPPAAGEPKLAVVKALQRA